VSDADEILGRPIGPPDFDEFWDKIDNRYFDRKGNPISMRDWTRLWDNFEYRSVGHTIVGDYEVSTVWLGLDHGWGRSRRIFETMVFRTSAPDFHLFEHLPEDWDIAKDGIPDEVWDERPEVTRYTDLDCERYATEKQALAGHKKIVKKWEARVSLLQDGLPTEEQP